MFSLIFRRGDGLTLGSQSCFLGSQKGGEGNVMSVYIVLLSEDANPIFLISLKESVLKLQVRRRGGCLTSRDAPPTFSQQVRFLLEF